MVRALQALALIAVTTLPAMAAEPDAAFDVATIRPHDPSRLGFGIQIQGRRLHTVATPVSSLIAFAYGLHPRQILDAPGWASSEKFDLMAEVTGAEDAANGPKMIERTQRLLADRFGLRFHREQKELPAYIIEVAKGGARFLDSKGDPNANPTYGFQGLGTMTVSSATIANFAGWMQRYVLDRPVIDRTGLAGKFNFELSWKADEFQFPDIAAALPRSTEEADRADLYTAIQQQLGLRIVPTKAQVEVFVIDRIERPSEN